MQQKATGNAVPPAAAALEEVKLTHQCVMQHQQQKKYTPDLLLDISHGCSKPLISGSMQRQLMLQGCTCCGAH